MRVVDRDIIQRVSDKTGISKRDVKIVVEAFVSGIKEDLLEGNSVLIWGLGLFSVKTRKATRVHNIDIKKVVDKPEKHFPKLDFSKQFYKMF